MTTNNSRLIGTCDVVLAKGSLSNQSTGESDLVAMPLQNYIRQKHNLDEFIRITKDKAAIKRCDL